MDETDALWVVYSWCTQSIGPHGQCLFCHVVTSHVRPRTLDASQTHLVDTDAGFPAAHVLVPDDDSQ